MVTPPDNRDDTPRTKTIVCAVDRRTAATVVRTAGDLALRLGARLVLASIAEQPSFALPRARRDWGSARAVERATQEVDRVVGEVPNALACRRRVEVGDPVERLLAIAGDEDAELTVLGSRGRGAFSSALLGSVSSEVARRAPCPVMIVTPRALKYSPARTASGDGARPSIVCGVDGSRQSLAAAHLAADLARRLGDRLLLLHAYDSLRGPPGDRTANDGAQPNPLELALTSIDGPAVGELRPMPAAYALESAANREAARLIVVGVRDRAALKVALVGSASAQLVRLAGCPIILLPDHAKLAPGSGHYETAGVGTESPGFA